MASIMETFPTPPKGIGINAPVIPSTVSVPTSKVFDGWYSRMENLISELKYQVNMIEEKSNNLYVEPNKEVPLAKSSTEHTDFSPTCFYECLVKVERDLAFIVGKMSAI